MSSRGDGSPRNRGIERIGPGRYRIRIQSRDARTGQKTSRRKIVLGTLADARRARDVLVVEARRKRERRERPTLTAYAQSWLTVKARALKPSVARKYMTSLDLHILPALGRMRMDSLQHTDVRKYVADRVKAGASGNTVLNELRLMRTLARDSVADGTAPRNWADRVKPPEVRRYSEERPNLLTADQLGKVLAAVPAGWSRLVRLLAFTGMRWGEVSALRWSDIDFDRGIITISRSNWKGRIVMPKTEASRRRVPLPPGVLSPLMQPYDSALSSFVFTTRDGMPHKGTPLVRVLRDASKAAGVPTVTPHGLRRTFNDLLRQHTDGDVVRSIIGHVTEQMTGHYSLIRADEKQVAQRKVLALLTPPDGAGSESPTGSDDGSEG